MCEVLDCYKMIRNKFKRERKCMEEEYSIYLCYILHDLWEDSKITRAVYSTVKNDIDNHMFKKTGKYVSTMMLCVKFDYNNDTPYEEMVIAANDYRLKFLNNNIKRLTRANKSV